MTIYYPPCNPEDGEGAPCGHCSLMICCYDHWKNNHMLQYHKDDLKCIDGTCDCQKEEDERISKLLGLGDKEE